LLYYSRLIIFLKKPTVLREFLITYFSLQVLPILIEFARGLPLVVFFVIYLITDDDKYLTIGLLIFFSILFLLTLVALVPTGSRKRGRLERIAR